MSTHQIHAERLFLNSLASPYTRNLYMIYLQKYLEAFGYRDLNDLADKGMQNPKQIENEIIDLIIMLKEKGTKRGAISNYTKSLVAFCKINDIILNTNKIMKFFPSKIRGNRTRAYSHSQIQKMLDIADERMRTVILLLCSSGLRIGSLPNLSVGSMKEVGDLYKITVYENELEEYITFCTPECRKIGIDVFSTKGTERDNRFMQVMVERYYEEGRINQAKTSTLLRKIVKGFLHKYCPEYEEKTSISYQQEISRLYSDPNGNGNNRFQQSYQLRKTNYSPGPLQC